MTKKQRARFIKTINYIIPDLQGQGYYQVEGKIYIKALEELKKELASDDLPQ